MQQPEVWRVPRRGCVQAHVLEGVRVIPLLEVDKFLVVVYLCLDGCDPQGLSVFRLGRAVHDLLGPVLVCAWQSRAEQWCGGVMQEQLDRMKGRGGNLRQVGIK